jgi:hypothetical protein
VTNPRAMWPGSAVTDALAAFYASTSGASWREPWDLSATDPCQSWAGFYCENPFVRIDGRLMDGSSDETSIFQGLHGTLPCQLGRVTEMIELVLISLPTLSGTIPPDLAALPYMRSLDLWRTKVSGTIPPSFSKPHLNIVGLSETSLSGTLPQTILNNLGSAQWFELRDVPLSGTLPLGSGQWLPTPADEAGHEFAVILARNRMSGTLPTQIGTRLSNVFRLSLQDTRFSGTLPSQLGMLSALHKLDLSDTDISGTLPTQLARLCGGPLKVLHASRTRLSGSAPTEIASLEEASLHLRPSRLPPPCPRPSLPPGFPKVHKLPTSVKVDVAFFALCLLAAGACCLAVTFILIQLFSRACEMRGVARATPVLRSCRDWILKSRRGRETHHTSGAAETGGLLTTQAETDDCSKPAELELEEQEQHLQQSCASRAPTSFL